MALLVRCGEAYVHQVRPQDQASFRTTCFDMCEVTTVADYNQLKAKLDEIAMDNPEIKPFIMYWHPHRSHVFKPFHGGGLPREITVLFLGGLSLHLNHLIG